ncbi:hypothetical protein LEP1GSC043_1548 [Leptospira weilii str. Ecochallenge]|uniref:Uncharacterized protein n=1 Tax=Leptospira weilii str. Ecochallenge TaxID=1049986 RepID=N1UBM4_9LEPT|nr:hypothetical protein LEP1GSC043_1548 [Leptospira weilii str. Ecochallenge]
MPLAKTFRNWNVLFGIGFESRTYGLAESRSFSSRTLRANEDLDF